jgi:hypothetical protein
MYNIKTRYNQNQYQTRMFNFSNSEEDKDIKIKMVVKSGKCDMYVNTYDKNDDS